MLTNLFAGYIGSVSFLNTILEVVNKLRSINPKLIYVEYIILTYQKKYIYGEYITFQIKIGPLIFSVVAIKDSDLDTSD